MNASEVGFNGEVNMFLPHPYLAFAQQSFKVLFPRGKTKHFGKAQENPNQFFWNKENENLYYINRDRKMFRVEFIEEGAK